MKNVILWMFRGMVVAVLAVPPLTVRAADEETAPFELVEKDGDFEIRDYPELVVASTVSAAGNDREADQRFMRLFRYIDGDNEGEKKISMTTPVFMGDSADGEKERMSFVIPAGVAKEGAPAPGAEDVTVEKLKPRRYAVYRFSGLRSDEREKEALSALEKLMDTRDLEADGAAIFAYYNPPWVPGFMRRNEVLVPLPDPPSE